MGTRQEDSYFWQFDPQQELFEGQYGVYTILDSGSDRIFISDIWFNSIWEETFGQSGVSYTINEGKVYFDCATDIPDLYYDFNGVFIQINSADYKIDLNDGFNTCSLLVEGIDAPFNILGVPAFLEYYITHNFGENTLTFRNIGDQSVKRDLTYSNNFDKELSVVYRTQNVDNGEQIATISALFIAVMAICISWYWAYVEFVYVTDEDYASFGIYGGAGTIVSLIGYFILKWILLAVLMPGDNIMDVDSPDSAIKNVHASHVTFLGLFSYAMYYIKKSRDERLAKKAKSAAPEKQAEARIEEAINTLE